jgi:hypothetical protein
VADAAQHVISVWATTFPPPTAEEARWRVDFFFGEIAAVKKYIIRTVPEDSVMWNDGTQEVLDEAVKRL